MKAWQSTRKTIGTALNYSWQAAQSASQRLQWLRLCRQIHGTDRPILVGPWRGEVGFEVLYWLPWLAKLREMLAIAPERLFPISRGGAASWYGTPQGLELYAIRTPQQVRIENKRVAMQTKEQKQRHVTVFDRDILNESATMLGLEKPIALHPAWMFAQQTPFWEESIGLMRLLDRANFAFPLPTPALPDTVKLPERFVAVKFYARHTFPVQRDTRTFVEATVRHLASQQPVVLLNADLHVDDHFDFPVTGPNIYQMRELVPTLPETNLAVQSAILAKAQGFVGTYGGFAQLALSLGKPAVSFYTQWGGTAIAHKHLADGLALRANIPWTVTPIGHLPMLNTVYPLVGRSDVAPLQQSA